MYSTARPSAPGRPPPWSLPPPWGLGLGPANHGVVEPSLLTLRIRKYLPLANNHTPLRPHNQLAKRVLHPQQSRRRLRALKDHIEPVAITQVAGFDILILCQFHISGACTSLDLNRQFLA